MGWGRTTFYFIFIHYSPSILQFLSATIHLSLRCFGSFLARDPGEGEGKGGGGAGDGGVGEAGAEGGAGRLS